MGGSGFVDDGIERGAARLNYWRQGEMQNNHIIRRGGNPFFPAGKDLHFGTMDWPDWPGGHVRAPGGAESGPPSSVLRPPSGRARPLSVIPWVSLPAYWRTFRFPSLLPPSPTCTAPSSPHRDRATEPASRRPESSTRFPRLHASTPPRLHASRPPVRSTSSCLACHSQADATSGISAKVESAGDIGFGSNPPESPLRLREMSAPFLLLRSWRQQRKVQRNAKLPRT